MTARKVSNSAKTAQLARSRHPTNNSVDAVIRRLCLHIDLSESIVMSLRLYRSLTDRSQRLDVLFCHFATFIPRPRGNVAGIIAFF